MVGQFQALSKHQRGMNTACVYVQGNHPALQLLRQRAAQGSLPNDRKDNFKLGLVVEGGGMRGAVSAGGLLELGNLGFR